MRNFCNIVVIVIASLIILIFVFWVIWLTSVIGVPPGLSAKILSMFKFMGSPPLVNPVVADDVSMIVMRNSAFILQFIAWLFTIGAFVLAVLGFVGVNRFLKLRDIEDRIKKKMDAFDRRELELKIAIDSFEKEIGKKQVEFMDAMGKANERLEKEMAISRARLFYLQGQKSEGSYEHALETLSGISDNYSWEVTFYKGMISSERGDYVDAINFFEKALGFSECDRARTFYNIGNCYRAKGRNDEAIEKYNEALRIKSVYGDAIVNKAMAFRAKKELKVAIRVLEEFIELDERHARGCYNLACYYCLNHDKAEKVIAVLKRAIELSSSKYKVFARTDPDLEPVRNRRDFKDLTGT